MCNARWLPAAARTGLAFMTSVSASSLSLSLFFPALLSRGGDVFIPRMQGKTRERTSREAEKFPRGGPPGNSMAKRKRSKCERDTPGRSRGGVPRSSSCLVKSSAAMRRPDRKWVSKGYHTVCCYTVITATMRCEIIGQIREKRSQRMVPLVRGHSALGEMSRGLYTRRLIFDGIIFVQHLLTLLLPQARESEAT